tara:strand:- start:8233 stop:8718 length:486 start_codon:yes stop_codon:yes gene_type:complete
LKKQKNGYNKNVGFVEENKMSVELLAMLGGSLSGFVMKLIAAQAQSQSQMLEGMLKKQEAADASADKAAARTGAAGAIVRRVIAICTLFAVIFAPFILAFFNEPVTIEANKAGGLFGFLFGDMFAKGNGWIELNGYVLLPEVRQTMLALVGFYFGSSQVKS